MKMANLEAALDKEPFRPFEIRVNGDTIAVHHPEHVLFAEGKSTCIVVDPEDHFHILDVDQISNSVRFGFCLGALRHRGMANADLAGKPDQPPPCLQFGS